MSWRGLAVARAWPQRPATPAGHMEGLLAQAGRPCGAVGGPVVMLDPLTRARVLGQSRVPRMRQALRTGVQSPYLGMAGAGLHYVVAVEDDHPAGTVGAVALKGAINVDQQRSRASRLRRHVAHCCRNHLHGRQLRV